MLKIFVISCILFSIVLIFVHYTNLKDCKDKGGFILETADGLHACVELRKIQ
jgi:hypothetical protein